MKREEFVSTFLEGALYTPKSEMLAHVVGDLFDSRDHVRSLQDMIAFMNDTARDSGWSMNCRSCGESYEPDCELSEMFGAENYCGKNQWCCP